MRKYVWVAVGILTSAIGGVTGVCVLFATFYQVHNQPAEVTANLIGYGGVFAAIAGGTISLSRGRPAERIDWLYGLLALACGVGIGAAVSPMGTLAAVNPLALILLVGVWPFALLGGLGMLALIWASLWAVGVRT